MKKSLILKLFAVILLIIFVVSIILVKSNDAVDEIKVMLDNTKIIKLYDYQTKELIRTFDEKTTEDVIKKLDYNKWKKSNSLNGDEKEYTLKLYENDDSEDIGTITIYKSMDYLIVNIENKVDEEIYKINTNIKDIYELGNNRD